MSFDSWMNILTLYRTWLSVVTWLINLSGVVNWNTAWGWNSSTWNWNSAYTWIQANSGNATAWTKSGTDVYYTGGNVGIGVASSASALDVNGAISSNSLAVVTIWSNSASTIFIAQDHIIQAHKYAQSLNLFGPQIGSGSYQQWNVVIGDPALLQFTGSVGIGYQPLLSDYKVKLQVNGALRLVKLASTAKKADLETNLGKCTSENVWTMWYFVDNTSSSLWHVAVCVDRAEWSQKRVEMSLTDTLPQ